MSQQNNITPLTINIPQRVTTVLENVIHTILPDRDYEPEPTEPENYNEHPAVSSNQNTPNAPPFTVNQPISIPIVTIHQNHVEIHNRSLNEALNTGNYTNN